MGYAHSIITLSLGCIRNSGDSQ